MSYDAGDAAIPASGTWGTCKWEIDKDGVLTVHPGEGTDTNSSNHPSWYSYRQSITSVKIVSEGGKKVEAPKYCYHLFSSYGSLKSADLSGLDTSNVSYMRSMFKDCSALASLSNVSDWNTSNVVDMETMLSGCSSLTSLDLSGWDTSKVTNMTGMFYGCKSLASLDLSGWDTSNVDHYDYVFTSCKSFNSFTIGSSYRIKDIYVP